MVELRKGLWVEARYDWSGSIRENEDGSIPAGTRAVVLKRSTKQQAKPGPNYKLWELFCPTLGWVSAWAEGWFNGGFPTLIKGPLWKVVDDEEA